MKLSNNLYVYDENQDLRTTYSHKKMINWLRDNQYLRDKKTICKNNLINHYFGGKDDINSYVLKKPNYFLKLDIPWNWKDQEKQIYPKLISEKNLNDKPENLEPETQNNIQTKNSQPEELVQEFDSKPQEELLKESKADIVLEQQDLNKNLEVENKSSTLESPQRNSYVKESDKVSFKIRAGEIYAIAGVEGNGQSQLALTIAGLLPAGHAKIIINGKDISKKSVYKRYLEGISDVSEDRHKHGLVLDLPIDKNSVLQEISQKPYSNLGFINQQAITKHAIEIINKYDVRGTTRGTTAARLLSGGNQQKLIIGREMERKHDLLILVQPTRGMDLGAISFVHQQILKEKAEGKAILLISYELDEILGLADTIAVMQNGIILEEGPVEIMTKQHIGELMAGKGK